MRKYLILFLFLLSITASADLGPKPTINFTLDEKTDLTITGGALLQSNTIDGSEAKPLQQMGPQRFRTEPTSCFAMAYGFAPYQQLKLTFSDGKTRHSNFFKSGGLHTAFIVIVKGDKLLLKPTKASRNYFD